MGIWRDLWPDENGECRLGAFTIPKKKKLAFLKTLKNILVPDGYVNIAETISDDIKFLAQGLTQDARRFSAYNINGFKFRTLSREQGSKTQNSGVFLISDTSCIASSVDRGYKTDAWKFNCVNFSKLIHTGDREDHDPYIEASQENMVYYVDDETNKEWSVAVHLKPRDLFEMGEVDEEDLYENEPYQQQEFGQFFDDDYENIQIAIEENMNE
ncbi:hypothetical protein RDI58_014828 [Solanum bulbocastanum]|uniref:DUF4216 domain-containing protein n=1 Tax=Solanum bulbocastanum TaxID=147425 RepID=A0AAN8TD36_SOLBU